MNSSWSCQSSLHLVLLLLNVHVVNILNTGNHHRIRLIVANKVKWLNLSAALRPSVEYRRHFGWIL